MTRCCYLLYFNSEDLRHSNRQDTNISNQSIKFVMATYPDPLVINPLSAHTQTIVLLHDCAGSNRHFAVELLEATDSAGNALRQALPGMKFIFPTALKQPSAVLEGYPIASWFDCILPIDPHETSKRQAEGLHGACLMIHRLLDTEVPVVGIGNVFLGGYGQGCATALYALLTYKSSVGGVLGGVIGLSGWLPMQKTLNDFALQLKRANDTPKNGEEVQKTLRIEVHRARLLEYSRLLVAFPRCQFLNTEDSYLSFFLAHGQADQEVPITHAREAAITLAQMAMDVNLKEYDGLGHTWRDGDVIEDIVRFIKGESGLGGLLYDSD